MHRTSLSEARSFLRSDAFEYLLDEANVEKKSLSRHKWKGHHVRAIDGTSLQLPAREWMFDEFPKRDIANAGHYPEGKLLTAMNLFTGQPVKAQLGSYKISEIRQLRVMIKGFKKGDLSVLDRGLWSRRIWAEFEKLQQHYICRVQTLENATLNEIAEFARSKKRSTIVEIKWGAELLTVRLIRSKSKDRNGDPIVFATNLLNTTRYKDKEIARLYLRRWEVETLYYRAKELLHIENFHAFKPNGIRQEVWANLIAIALTARLCDEAEASKPKHEKARVNFKNAVEVLRRHIYLIINNAMARSKMKRRLRQAIAEVAMVLCHRQPGRKNKRLSHQPLNDWNRGQHGKNRPKNKRERDRLEALRAS